MRTSKTVSFLHVLSDPALSLGTETLTHILDGTEQVFVPVGMSKDDLESSFLPQGSQMGDQLTAADSGQAEVTVKAHLAFMLHHIQPD